MFKNQTAASARSNSQGSIEFVSAILVTANQMSKISTSCRKGLLKDHKDNEEAAAYLNAALEDESKEVFMLALRDVADAKGILDLAEKIRTQSGKPVSNTLWERQSTTGQPFGSFRKYGAKARSRSEKIESGLAQNQIKPGFRQHFSKHFR